MARAPPPKVSSDPLRSAGAQLGRYMYHLGLRRLPHPIKLFLVDIFSGTGSMSKVARHAGFEEVISVDISGDAAQPTVLGDIMDLRVMAEVKERIVKLLSKGWLPLLHLSPPCEAFSIANPRSSSENMDQSISVFHEAMQLAHMLPVYMVENPASGRLWVQWARHAVPGGEQGIALAQLHPLDLRLVVNYCMYGKDKPKKPTAFAFSHKGFMERFKPLRCNCPGVHEVKVHQMRGHERGAIPPKLAVGLLQAAAEFLRDDVQPVVASQLTKLGGLRPHPSSSDSEGSDSLYEVDRILAARTVTTGTEYLVRWSGKWASEKHDSWEPDVNLACAKHAVKMFNRKTKKPKPN